MFSETIDLFLLFRMRSFTAIVVSRYEDTLGGYWHSKHVTKTTNSHESIVRRDTSFVQQIFLYPVLVFKVLRWSLKLG